jgi:hypothetical protein
MDNCTHQNLASYPSALAGARNAQVVRCQDCKAAISVIAEPSQIADQIHDIQTTLRHIQEEITQLKRNL